MPAFVFCQTLPLFLLPLHFLKSTFSQVSPLICIQALSVLPPKCLTMNRRLQESGRESLCVCRPVTVYIFIGNCNVEQTSLTLIAESRWFSQVCLNFRSFFHPVRSPDITGLLTSYQSIPIFMYVCVNE